MKRKHNGLITVVLLMTGLVLAGGYALYGGWRTKATMPTRPVLPLPDVKVPGPATLQEIALLSKEIKRLAYPPPAGARSVDLGLFGYRPTDGSGRVVLAGAQRQATSFDYQLSLAFYSKQEQFCIIDGSFYRVGGRLPDDGRIVKIESTRVLVARQGVKRWVPLADRDADSDQTMATPTKQGNS